MKSDYGRINTRDWIRGLLVSVLPVLGNIGGYLYPIFNKGIFPTKEEWITLSAKAIGWLMLSVFGYLGVNAITNKNGGIGKNK